MENNVRHYLEGYGNYIADRADILSKHIREQAIFRAYKCIKCLRLTHCEGCKCKAPALFYAPNKKDKYGKWSKMLNSKQWADFKLTSQDWQDFMEKLKDLDVSLNDRHILSKLAYN